MFTYFKSKQKFLDDISDESSLERILKKMESEINRWNEVRGFDPVSDSDRSSWKTSMEKFSNVIGALDENTDIAFEYILDHRGASAERYKSYRGYSKRIDVLVGGVDKTTGKKTAVVVEMKQWGGDQDNRNRLRIEDKKDGSHILSFYNWGKPSENNPSKEAKDYCELLRETNQSVFNGDIKLIPMVWLFNYDPKEQREKNGEDADAIKYELEDRYKYDDGEKDRDIHVFYKGQEEDVQAFFESLFGKKDTVFSELRKGYSYHILHDEIAELIDPKIPNPIKYRMDQLDCLNGLKEDLKNGETGYYYVRGSAGSGKSVIGISLLRFCIEENISVKYLVTEGAPVNAYTCGLDEKQKDLFALASSWNPENDFPKKVLIIDEAHNLGANTCKKLFNDDSALLNDSFVVILYDDDQRTLNDVVRFPDDPQYSLCTQFRCNGENGYLKFIDEILQNEEDPIYTADLLDFDLKLIRDRETLIDLFNSSDIPLLTGPKYRTGNLVIGENELPVWKYKPGQVYLNDIKNGNRCYSICESVRGLETEKVIVYIADGPDDLHFDSETSLIEGTDDVKNKYRVMLSRAMKSCYIYCENEGLRDHLHKVKKIRYY